MDLTKSVGLAIHWHYTLWMLDSSLWLTAHAQIETLRRETFNNMFCHWPLVMSWKVSYGYSSMGWRKGWHGFQELISSPTLILLLCKVLNPCYMLFMTLEW